MTSPVSDGRPAEPPAPSPKKPEPVPPARPSGAQIIASVLTATTTTFALSYLGVAGTIIGAGLASTFTVLANYWYTRSIIHTQRKVNQIAPKVARARAAATPGAAARPAAPSSEGGATVTNAQTAATSQVASATSPVTAVEPAEDRTLETAPTPALSDTQTSPATDDTQTLPAQAVDDTTQAGRGEKLMAPARAGKRRVLIPIALLFVLLLAVVTAVELGLGKPLSDALRGQEGTGTSVFHNSGARTPVQDEPGGGSNEEEPANPDQSAGPTEDSTTEPDDAELSEPATTEPAAPETTEPAPQKPTAPAEPTEPAEPAGPDAAGAADTGAQGSGNAEAEGPTTPPTADAGAGAGSGSEPAQTPPPTPKGPAQFSASTNG